MKKNIILALSGLVCICLTGCGRQAKEIFTSSNMQGTPHSVEIEYGIENVVSVTVKADIKESRVQGNMAVAGQVPKSAEFYREDDTSYVYDTDLEYWTGTKDGIITDMAFLFDSLDPELFPDEKVKYDKKQKAYIIKQPFEDFVSTQDYTDMAALLSEMGIATGGSSDDAYVYYAFDKEGHLTSVTADAPIKMDIRFTPFELDVEIPEGVKESAVVSDFCISFEDIYEMMAESSYGTAGGTPTGNTGTASSIDPGFIIDYEGDMDPGMAAGSSSYENIDPKMLIRPGTGEGYEDHEYQGNGYGEYDGNGLSDAGNEWAAAFGDSGWKFTTDDYTENCMKAENPQYPGSVFTVYGADESHETSAYNIIKYGFYSYDIDCHKADEYPPFAWNGVTFGAQAAQIEAAYGEPDVTYDGDGETVYRYFLEHGDIMFFLREGRGLDRVTFSR